MLQIVLLAGKFVLLIILYLFILAVVRSTTQEMRLSGAASKRHGARQFGPVAAGAGPVVASPGVAGMPGAAAGLGAAVPGGAPSPDSTWRLITLKSPFLHHGENFAFPPGSRAAVGRSPEMDIFLDDTFVSSRHAFIEAIRGGFQIEDLHSTNGTLVNGQEVSGVRQLRPGDQIEIGDTVFRVEVR